MFLAQQPHKLPHGALRTPCTCIYPQQKDTSLEKTGRQTFSTGEQRFRTRFLYMSINGSISAFGKQSTKDTVMQVTLESFWNWFLPLVPCFIVLPNAVL
jgi:hypothetical protein